MLAKVPIIESTGNSTAFYCIQSEFKRNTANCWFASALCSYANNVSKEPITLEFMWDVERRAYEEFYMPIWWFTIASWIKKISKLLDTDYELFKFDSPRFHFFLKRWYTIAVPIMITEKFMEYRRAQEIIGDCYGPQTGNHALCIRENKEGSFINSRKENNPMRKYRDLKIEKVFKTRDTCGVIIKKTNH